MIKVFTGANGAGKTLRMIWYMLQLRKSEPDRPMFYHGIHGLTIPGIEHLDDPKKWMDCPNGSVIFLDEAQAVFRAQQGAAVPKHLTELEEHRHRGIDFYMTTQHPGFLHTHIRKLNPTHEHLVSLTNNSARIFSYNEINQNPETKRSGADFKVWVYPKEIFSCYESATMHTKRIQFPPWLKKAIIFIAIAAILFGYVFYGVSKDVKHGQDAPSAAVYAPGARPKPLTAEEYVHQFVPRLASKPWSAPAWDGRSPSSSPEIYCIELQDDDALRCSCVTEQGTDYDLPPRQCHRIALHGNYNPYRDPPSEQDSPSRSRDQSPDRSSDFSSVQSSPAGIPAPPRGWGANEIHDAYQPPEYGHWNAENAFGSSTAK
ncbi:zonular occludens toxin domain-containing protein [Oleiagrimonas soli]|uniref:Zona occludens toxin N-terminal domain-containing protein n=1 Tax=Oleiagrimonas soli TaxID=1543381 RepID=A0A841KH16_9GAMM|nr:zonular occludens toxin domain-containing protein [Oleiagrimonas soli]MBB6183287.1 hypothetical protein [Oleiagrimonas soli]